MEISKKFCRLCLTESDFNVSLFGNYCRKVGMSDKILVCLKIVIEETDFLNTICYKCANSVEKYYDFINYVKKSQTKLGNCDQFDRRSINVEASPNNVNRHVTSYVREQVFDANYTFSFLEVPEEKKPAQTSSPFFSYFSPPNVLVKQSEESLWKTPRAVSQDIKKEVREEGYKRPRKDTPRHHSRDLFESQSQDFEEEPRTLDWKLTPDDNIIKRVREKCFGRADF